VQTVARARFAIRGFPTSRAKSDVILDNDQIKRKWAVPAGTTEALRKLGASMPFDGGSEHRFAKKRRKMGVDAHVSRKKGEEGIAIGFRGKDCRGVARSSKTIHVIGGEEAIDQTE